MTREEILKDWSEEFDYCKTLLRTRGNRSVPQDAVASYLLVQAAGARRDGTAAGAHRFTEAARLVTADDWDAAYDSLGDWAHPIPAGSAAEPK